MSRERFLVMTILWLRNHYDVGGGPPHHASAKVKGDVIRVVDKILHHVGDPAEVSATGEYAAFLQELEQYK